MPHHHPTNAIREQRPADHADGGRGRRSKEGAAGRRLCHGLLWHWLRLITGRSAHGSSCGLAARPHRWDRACAWRFAASKYALAHALKEAALPRRLAARAKLRFELADADIGALERLVLDQRGLHQCIGRVGGSAEAILNQALGLSVAGVIFKRCQAIKQVGDLIAFLWGHRLVLL
jgi:hypothetical protein